MRRYLMPMAAAVMAGMAFPLAASAQDAVTTVDLNMRAGPSTDFPVVDVIPSSAAVDIHGCVSGYRWCDVTAVGSRGWVYAEYLSYARGGSYVPLTVYAEEYDVPIISFSVGSYWDSYYRGRPWYSERARWRARWRDNWHGIRRDFRAQRRENRREERVERREERRDAIRERPRDRRDARVDRRRDAMERREERRDRVRERRRDSRADRREQRQQMRERRRESRDVQRRGRDTRVEPRARPDREVRGRQDRGPRSSAFQRPGRPERGDRPGRGG